MLLKRETLRNLNDQELHGVEGAVTPVVWLSPMVMAVPTKCVAGSKLAQSVNYCPTEQTVINTCSLDPTCRTTGGC